MPDLKLDPITGDLYLLNGVASLTDDATGETTAQRVRTTLRMFAGEWFLDNRLGVDWLGQILVKNPNMGNVQETIKTTIRGVTGVLNIVSYNQVFDRVARTLTVNVQITDDLLNVLSISEVLP